MKTNPTLSTLLEAECNQIKWIEDHGYDLDGYIEMYGIPGTYKTVRHRGKDYTVPAWSGNGGAEIYAADMAELERIRAQIRVYFPRGQHGWLLVDGDQGEQTLRELLHNLSQSVAGRPDYCRGIIVGAASAMIAMGMTHDEACQLLWQCLPKDVDPEGIPPAWKSEFGL